MVEMLLLRFTVGGCSEVAAGGCCDGGGCVILAGDRRRGVSRRAVVSKTVGVVQLFIYAVSGGGGGNAVDSRGRQHAAGTVVVTRCRCVFVVNHCVIDCWVLGGVCVDVSMGFCGGWLLV